MGSGCRSTAPAGVVRILSRTLDDVTAAFPELLAPLGSLAETYILDGEVVAWKGARALEFFLLQQRLQRRDPGPLLEGIPVVLVAFDLLHLDGRDLLTAPLEERRAALAGARRARAGAGQHRGVRRGPRRSWTRRFREARGAGNEGIVMKRFDAPYQPGRRGRLWMKWKPGVGTLDVVVVAAEYGHGKRAGVLSDYTFAVRDGDAARDDRQGVQRADRRRDRRADGVVPRPHAARSRRGPSRRAGGRARGRLRRDHAQRAARLGVRAALSPDRARPGRQAARGDQHARRRADAVRAAEPAGRRAAARRRRASRGSLFRSVEQPSMMSRARWIGLVWGCAAVVSVALALWPAGTRAAAGRAVRRDDRGRHPPRRHHRPGDVALSPARPRPGGAGQRAGADHRDRHPRRPALLDGRDDARDAGLAGGDGRVRLPERRARRVRRRIRDVRREHRRDGADDPPRRRPSGDARRRPDSIRPR